MQEIQETYNATKGRGMMRPDFMVGALVGAGVALLLAPAAGRDTRRKIGETAQRLGSGAKNVVSRTRETLGGIKQDARSAIEGGRREFQRSRHERNTTANRTAGF